VPILKTTAIVGTVETLLVNGDADSGLATTGIGSAKVNFDGIEGDCHSSLVREACVRTREQYAIGTPIRNTRHFSILSVEDLAVIAAKMGVPHLKPEWVGANLLLSGIPNFTQLPPSSRLIFSGGVSLVVDMENEPCKYPGEIIEMSFPGKGHLFAYNARGLRGVTAWVEKEGRISQGDTVSLHIPPQRIYDVEALALKAAKETA